MAAAILGDVKPISQLSEAEARGLRGVCFDVDDTVTTGGVLDPGAYSALHALRAAGLSLVAATGRPLGWAELFARLWPVQAAVGENGAGWYWREGGAVREGYADPPEVRAEQRRRLDVLEAQVRQQLPHVRPSSDSWCRRCDLAFDVGELTSLPPEEIAALVSLIESAGARAVVSTVHAHAAFGQTDKATGIQAAVRDALDVRLEDEREAWLFVGDSGNDAAAFAWFDLSAGVANVADFLPSLPRAPRYVASLRSGAGFAEIAETVLRRRAGT